VKKVLVVRNRIPLEFFTVSGAGESNITIHAGSYDAAVKDAGIENHNLISYTSILPKEAKQVQKEESYTFGSVAEAITAVSNSTTGRRATAGLIYGWVYHKKKKIGGLVAEYNEHGTEEVAKKTLRTSIDEMFFIRYGKNRDYQLCDVKIVMNSIVPKKKYGTAIAAIVFVSYLYPLR